MNDFRNDEIGDFDFENGDIVEIEGSEAYGQHVGERLRMFKGEWFLDLDEGTPYYESILVKNPNPLVVDAILKERIYSSPGIVELVEFQSEYDNATRALSIQWRALSTDGQVGSDDTLGG